MQNWDSLLAFIYCQLIELIPLLVPLCCFECVICSSLFLVRRAQVQTYTLRLEKQDLLLNCLC